MRLHILFYALLLNIKYISKVITILQFTYNNKRLVSAKLPNDKIILYI